MHAKFLIDDDLSKVCGSEIDTVQDYLTELQTINSEIKTLLQDEGWQGDAHDKCVGAVKLMEEYRADLSSMLDTLKSNFESVVNDAQDFVNNSDKVSSIRKV